MEFLSNLDLRWAVLFLAQLGTGLYLTTQGDGELRTLGIGLIGGAFGQGATANLKATK